MQQGVKHSGHYEGIYHPSLSCNLKILTFTARFIHWPTFTVFIRIYSKQFFVTVTNGILLYRAAQNSVNLKHAHALAGMFRFKLENKFVERYQSVVGCALSTEDLILNNFGKVSK
jgi:hypothetical protein